MTSHFVPFVPARKPVVARRVPAARVAWCVLAAIALLEAIVLFFPQRMVLSPAQAAPWFKQLTGYTMVGLMFAAMVFGPLRRSPAVARHHAWLNDLHQFSGLVFLLLLAFHVGPSPRGFLLVLFHALAIAAAAGALRAAGGRRIGRVAAKALLVVHIGLCCVLSAGVLVHLYLVYAYTA